MSQDILLIDNDPLPTRTLVYALERAGYSVCAAASAGEGLDLARRTPPDLILLEIGLPGAGGFEALHLLRRELKAPVILLTVRRGERDEALGLNLGADDYIKKPYDMEVLLARIEAVLRRSRPGGWRVSNPELVVGNLRIDTKARAAYAGNELLDLTPRAFDLLACLAQQAGAVATSDHLMRRVWGRDFEGETQVLYVHIRWLREELARVPGCNARIVTVHRVGYKLVEAEARYESADVT